MQHTATQAPRVLELDRIGDAIADGLAEFAEFRATLAGTDTYRRRPAAPKGNA